MLLAGDEAGHSQKGNNNAYCQDNEISWITGKRLTRILLNLLPHLFICGRVTRFFAEALVPGPSCKTAGMTDIAWFLPDATEMTDEHWQTEYAKSLGSFLWRGLHTVDQENKPVFDDSFYMIFNAHFGPLEFKLPEAKYGKCWKMLWIHRGRGIRRNMNRAR